MNDRLANLMDADDRARLETAPVTHLLKCGEQDREVSKLVRNGLDALPTKLVDRTWNEINAATTA